MKNFSAIVLIAALSACHTLRFEFAENSEIALAQSQRLPLKVAPPFFAAPRDLSNVCHGGRILALTFEGLAPREIWCTAPPNGPWDSSSTDVFFIFDRSRLRDASDCPQNKVGNVTFRIGLQNVNLYRKPGKTKYSFAIDGDSMDLWAQTQVALTVSAYRIFESRPYRPGFAYLFTLECSKKEFAAITLTEMKLDDYLKDTDPEEHDGAISKVLELRGKQKQ